MPQASVFATLINPSYPEAKAQSDEFQAAAAQLGARSIVLSAGTDADIDDAFATLKQQQIGAIVLANDPFFSATGEISAGVVFAAMENRSISPAQARPIPLS